MPRGTRECSSRATAWDQAALLFARQRAFLFASEVRALLSSGSIAPHVAADSLEAYLLFGAVAERPPSSKACFLFHPAIPSPCRRTLLGGPPAETLWDFSAAALQTDSPRPKNFKDAAKQLRSLLEETVRDHLNADVPLGVFLSSGLDSTALVALASRCRSDLCTSRSCFPNKFQRIENFSRDCQHFKTNHQEVLLTPDQVLAQLDDAVNALDQPTWMA